MLCWIGISIDVHPGVICNVVFTTSQESTISPSTRFPPPAVAVLTVGWASKSGPFPLLSQGAKASRAGDNVRLIDVRAEM